MDKGKKGTIVLIVVGIAILGGIILFAQPSEKKEEVKDAETTQATEEQTAEAGEAGKLGPNEVSITAANFDQEVVKGSTGKLVVVDVYAPWCPHCQVMGPIATDLSNEYDPAQVKFGKMNADNQDSAQEANFNFALEQGLQGYPTFWFYKDGKKVGEFSGEKTKDEFKAEIEKYI